MHMAFLSTKATIITCILAFFNGTRLDAEIETNPVKNGLNGVSRQPRTIYKIVKHEFRRKRGSGAAD